MPSTQTARDRALPAAPRRILRMLWGLALEPQDPVPSFKR